jgi:hypothetical protein
VIEITRRSKNGGPLTKQIKLTPDGSLISDGSACLMARGVAQRVKLDSLREVANLIQQLESNEAIALGALRTDPPDTVDVTTQKRLAKLNGSALPNLIARNSSRITYQAGRPALALIDFDTNACRQQ